MKYSNAVMCSVFRIILDKIYEYQLQTCDNFDEIYGMLYRWPLATIKEKEDIYDAMKEIYTKQLGESIEQYTYGSWVVYLFSLSMHHFMNDKEDLVSLSCACNLLLSTNLSQRIDDKYHDIVHESQGVEMVRNMLQAESKKL